MGRESEGERKREGIIEVGNGKRSGKGRLAGRKRRKREGSEMEKNRENDEEEKRSEGREKRKRNEK